MKRYFKPLLGSKTLIVLVILAMTLVACKSKDTATTPEEINNEQLLGIWQIDTVFYDNAPLNRVITFTKDELIFFWGPDGEITWPGQYYNMDYKLTDKQTMTITGTSPDPSIYMKSFEYSTHFYITNDTCLYLDNFSFDGVRFYKWNFIKRK